MFHLLEIIRQVQRMPAEAVRDRGKQHVKCQAKQFCHAHYRFLQKQHHGVAPIQTDARIITATIASAKAQPGTTPL